jgi:F-type H+-transporting ATPase subunit delta
MTSDPQAVTGGEARRDEIASHEADVVRQYAEALVSAAVSEGQAESALEDLEAIEHELLGAHPQLRRLLKSAQVSASEKDRILVELLNERVSGVVLRFLRVLNRRGRLGLISPVEREARRLWDRRHHRIPVSVRTAVPLDTDQETALRDKIARMISGTPLLQISTDPALIGGLVVQVGDQVCDASVRNRLEQVRQRLIEGKTHEIQSRRDQFSHPA